MLVYIHTNVLRQCSPLHSTRLQHSSRYSGHFSSSSRILQYAVKQNKKKNAGSVYIIKSKLSSQKTEVIKFKIKYYLNVL